MLTYRGAPSLFKRAGGRPFHNTSTHAFDFPGAQSFAPLFHPKGRGLDTASPPNLRDNHCFRSADTHRFARFRATGFGTYLSAELLATKQISLKTLAL